jgi:hypothetical protein
MIKYAFSSGTVKGNTSRCIWKLLVITPDWHLKNPADLKIWRFFFNQVESVHIIGTIRLVYFEILLLYSKSISVKVKTKPTDPRHTKWANGYPQFPSHQAFPPFSTIGSYSVSRHVRNRR